MNKTHLVLLAKNLAGFKNLVRINNAAWRNLRPPRYPTVTWDMLARFSAGLVCTTACIGGPVGVAVRKGRYDRAEELYKKLLDIFGGDFYPEVSGHPLLEQPSVNQAVLVYAKRSGRPPMLTNDCHYLKSDDWFIHNLYIKTREKKPRSFSYTATCFYLKTPSEMRGMDFPEGFSDVTVEIAESCGAFEELGRFLAGGRTVDIHVPFDTWPSLAGGFSKISESKKRTAMFPSRGVPITPKMAMGDAGRVLRLQKELLNEFAAGLDPQATLEDAGRRSRRLRAFSEKYPLFWQGALGLEGLPRYVEPDFDVCVDVDEEALSLLPIRNADGLMVIDVEAEVLRRLGVPVRRSCPDERRNVQRWKSYFDGMKFWWNDSFDEAADCLEKAISVECPVQAYFLLADSLAERGKVPLAKNILRSLMSSDSHNSPAILEKARRALSAMGDLGGAAPGPRRHGRGGVSIDNLPDFSVLYLNGRLGADEVQKAVGCVEGLLEDDVGVVAVKPDAASSRSAFFLPLLIGLDAFLRRYRGRIYRLGPRRPGVLLNRWFAAFKNIGNVLREIPQDVALHARPAPELVFRAKSRGRQVRHSQLIRGKIPYAVLRDQGGRSWRLQVDEISGESIRLIAPKTRLAPACAKVELEVGRARAISESALAVKRLGHDRWLVLPPVAWSLRPMRVGRRRPCRIPARMVSCMPGGAPSVEAANVTDLSLSGCVLVGGNSFAENESIALILGTAVEVVVAAWKIRQAQEKSVWAFYDYESSVRGRLVKSFSLSE